mgnify:CR=1 FL=1
MQNRFRLRALALAVSSALILTACGGGGSSATITADFAKWATQIHDGEPVAACYAWTEPNTCKILIWHTDTPFSRTYTFRFSDQGVSLSVQQNVAFGPTTFGPFESSAG